MRPLRGVVVAAGRTLTILLESGQSLSVPNKHGNVLGDNVEVGYNFISMKPTVVLQIDSGSESTEGSTHKPKTTSQKGKYYNEGHLVAFQDSGALHPLGVMGGSGVVLELSDGEVIGGRMLWPHEQT